MVKCCNGPCAQGRLPCPTPEACELEEVPFYETRIKDAIVALLLVCAIVLVVLVSAFYGVPA